MNTDGFNNAVGAVSRGIDGITDGFNNAVGEGFELLRHSVNQLAEDIWAGISPTQA